MEWHHADGMMPLQARGPSAGGIQLANRLAERTLITGGRVFTADHQQLWAEAVVLDGSTIGFVGSYDEAAAYASPSSETLDLDGGLLLPGFIDGHVHIAMTGAALRKAQLRGAVDLAEIQRRLRSWADEYPDAPRVLGTGWLYDAVPDGGPTREMLDEVIADRPVYLEAFDLHSSWLNSAALAEVGVDAATPDPVGGRIVRDGSTGQATGWLLETAHVNLVWSLLGDVGPRELDEQVAAALDAYARSGITSVVEMALDHPGLAALARARRNGTLTARVVAHMIVNRSGDRTDELAQVASVVEAARRYTGDHLRVAGIKLIADGTIDGCTAALSEPYTTGASAEPIWDSASMAEVIAVADEAGLQVAVHAIGDRTVRQAIDAIVAAAEENGTSARRHRIEHLEYVDSADIPRLGAAGITASMQPVHLDPAILGMTREVLGAERAETGFAWPRYLETGATLVFGTDTPTAPFEPLPNMYLATTRRSPTDPTLAPLRPDWALPLEQAITSASRDSAKAAWLDHVTGSISAGRSADLVVLDRDPFAEGPEVLLDAEVRMTMLEGRPVYRRRV